MADTFVAYPLSIQTLEKENRQVIVLDGSASSSASDAPGSRPTTPAQQSLHTILHQINALAHGFKQSNFQALVPPPPPNSINPHRSPEIERKKKQGNEAFTRKSYMESLGLYSAALDLAASRPPWEPSTLAQDELSVLLCNRSAAFLGHATSTTNNTSHTNTGAGGVNLNGTSNKNGNGNGNEKRSTLPEAYADAAACVKMKPTWVKGYYRLSRVCLRLGRLKEARDVVRRGLQYDPLNEDLCALEKEVAGALLDEAAVLAQST